MSNLSRGVRGLLSQKGNRIALSEGQPNRMKVGTHAHDALLSLQAFYKMVRRDTLTERDINMLWQHLDMTEISLQKARKMLEGILAASGQWKLPKGGGRLTNA